jgi:hypothetical protein
MHREAGVIMTIKMRRLIVVVPIASILLLANFLALGDWLSRAGVIGWARSIHAEYVTGTAVTVIAVLLILLPTRARGESPVTEIGRACPVCEQRLRPGGRYCPACGSRV